MSAVRHPAVSPESGTREHPALVPLAWCMVVAYLVPAALVMWRAPRVPYADGWRFLGHFAREPFPRDVLMADNGHFEVVPNLVRVLDMHLFGANQSLQVVVGMVLLAATLATAWHWLKALPVRATRVAAMLVVVMGLCWMGNVRALAHGNESVHAYAITLSLVLGIGALSRERRPGVGDALLAVLCGLVATTSFGSGIACFVAFLVVAWLRRAAWPAMAILLGGTVFAYLLLRLAGAGATPGRVTPHEIDLVLRWLGAPWPFTIWPAVDPAIAERVPTAFARSVAVALARCWEAAFGPAMLARWPQAAFGAGGLVLLAALTWRSFRGQAATRPRLLGLGLAWFAVAVAVMVAVVRTSYFDRYPEQLMALRYVVWSSLFWCGLGLALVAGAARGGRALSVVLVIGALLLPSQAWMWQIAESMRQVSAQTAVAAAVGVLEPELRTGETVPAELERALPSLRAAEVAVFAWPETALLGAPAPEGMRDVALHDVVVERVDNLLGAPGRRIRANASGAVPERLLLVDGDGIVRGLAIPDHAAGGDAWIGWMAGGEPRPAPRAGELPRR